MPCLALRAPPDHPVRALLLQSNIVQKMIEYPELIYTFKNFNLFWFQLYF